jgi:predicted DNA-binding transcriptional regulator YafY
MRIDRLLSIVLILLKRQRTTAPELSEELGVSVRTIYRDLDAITSAGIPIQTCQGVGGGVGLMPGYKLDRQVLTVDEMLSILTALRGITEAFDDGPMKRARQKVETLLPSPAIELADEVVIDFVPRGDGELQRGPLTSIHEAIRARRLLQFRYARLGPCDVPIRTVEPLTLVLKGSAWYLFAHCRLRDDLRLFRVVRMRDLVIQPQSFERRPVRYLDFAREHEDRWSGPSLSLTLRFSEQARTAVEESFGAESVQEQPDGSLLLQTTMPENQWVFAMILSFGPLVEVVEPARVREEIQERASATWQQYSGRAKT